MKSTKLMIALLGSLALASLANATVTWTFGGNPALVTQGATYSIPVTSAGGGTINVYAEQVNGSGVLQSTPDSTLCNTASPTPDCLFQTNTSVYPDGTGIAPYDPQENGVSQDFTTQAGITETNILEIELGSNIASGTTLSFLLQSGVLADNDDTVSVYTDTTSSPFSLNATGVSVFDNSVKDPIGGISTTGTTAQFTITKTTSGTEFVAIQSDCVYLLLDSITGAPPSGTTSSVPEPRFYGLLLAGLLGLASMYRRFAPRKA